MTKQQEIDAIRAFAAQFDSRNTYLGAWLNEVLPEIENDIRSDFPVRCRSIGELHAQRVQIKADCDKLWIETNEKITARLEEQRKALAQSKANKLMAIKAELERQVNAMANEIAYQLNY